MSGNAVSEKVLEEMETKINLLSGAENLEFVQQIKHIMEYINHFDITAIDMRTSAKIFPIIQNRFEKVLNENYCLFETAGDEVIVELIKEHLEMIFQLTEIVQEFLNYIDSQSPVELRSIGSILKYLPCYFQIFTEHWGNSNDAYKNSFMEELSKILEVMKHLYARFLYLLEFSINIQDEIDIKLLTDALIILCKMQKTLCYVDDKAVISSWKCFGTLTARYSSLLENSLDVRIPIKLLTEDICRLMESLHDQDLETFRRQLKIILFLRRILLRILVDIFYQQLNNFASELLIFYVRVLSFSPEYYIERKISEETVQAIKSEIFIELDEFLRHLILGQSIIKDHMVNLSDKLRDEGIYNTHPSGFLCLLNKVMQLIGNIECDWSEILANIMKDIFEVLPYCQKELFLDSYEGGIYQGLIVNISAAILRQDVQCCSTQLLLKYVLQDNIFVALLAVEVYTLVLSNIPPDECLLLLVNLLYGLDDILNGFFTCRPEMVHFQCLLRRLFNILPDSLKEHVDGMFAIEHHPAIWKFLGLECMPFHLIQPALSPILEVITEQIKALDEMINEDIFFNIVEGINLISPLNDEDILGDPRYSEIVSFMGTFWSLDLDREILDNNLMIYFIANTTTITASSINRGNLDPRLVFQQFKLFLNNRSYRVPIFKMITSLLYHLPLIESHKQKEIIISQIADVVPLTLNDNVLFRETYLEMLKTLNESHNDVMNLLLDTLNSNTASQIFEYMTSFAQANQLDINSGYFLNMGKFKHMCLQWTDEVWPPMKKFKYDDNKGPALISKSCQNQNNTPAEIIQPVKKKNRKAKQHDPSVNSTNDEDDSSATEVIQRMKGEIKCLFKVCKTEKLSSKNVSDLRVLMSQISSLM